MSKSPPVSEPQSHLFNGPRTRASLIRRLGATAEATQARCLQGCGAPGGRPGQQRGTQCPRCARAMLRLGTVPAWVERTGWRWANIEEIIIIIMTRYISRFKCAKCCKRRPESWGDTDLGVTAWRSKPDPRGTEYKWTCGQYALLARLRRMGRCLGSARGYEPPAGRLGHLPGTYPNYKHSHSVTSPPILPVSPSVRHEGVLTEGGAHKDVPCSEASESEKGATTCHSPKTR